MGRKRKKNNLQLLDRYCCQHFQHHYTANTKRFPFAVQPNAKAIREKPGNSGFFIRYYDFEYRQIFWWKQTNKTEKINSLWREHLEVKWECWVLNNLHILDLYKHQFLLPNLSIFIRHSIDRWFSYFNYQWM